MLRKYSWMLSSVWDIFHICEYWKVAPLESSVDWQQIKRPDFVNYILETSRSQWPRGLRRRYAAARLLRSWVRTPPRAWMFVLCECCVLSVRGFCDELITRPEESYRLRCIVVCNLENLKNEEAMTCVGSQRHSKKKKYIYIYIYIYIYWRLPPPKLGIFK